MANRAPTVHPSVEVAGINGNFSGYVFNHENTQQITATTFATNTSNDSAIPDYACFSITEDHQVLLANRIYLYTSLVFVLFGLIGNTLSVLVFSSKPMRVISSNFFLLMLALSDSFYLISVFLAKLLATLRCLHFKDTQADILNHSDILCKLLHFFSDLFSDYSSMLILCFTIERVIAVYVPLKFKEICTLRRAKIISLSLLFAIVVLIAPYHFIMIGLHEEFPVCIVSLNWEVEFTVAYMVEALIFRIVPVFVIAVLNIFIIVRVTEVAQIKKRRKANQSAMNNAHHATELQNGVRKKQRREDKSMQLTVMLILVSTSYILAYLPVLIHFVLWKLMRSDVITLSASGMEIGQKYTSTLYIAGFAINFFLYTIGGKIFRDQLRDILCGAIGYKKYGSSTEMTTLV